MNVKGWHGNTTKGARKGKPGVKRKKKKRLVHLAKQSKNWTQN